jgi:hypothetical protein
MEMTMKKTLVTAAALAILLAAPAFAQTRDDAASNPTSPYAAPHNGQARDPDAVMGNGKVIGHDPDPWIRNEILRHYDSAWPD